MQGRGSRRGRGRALHRLQRLNCEGETVIDEEIEGVDVGCEQGSAVTADGFQVVHAGVLGAMGSRGRHERRGLG